MKLENLKCTYPIGCVIAYANYQGAVRHAQVVGYEHYMNGHFMLRCHCEAEVPGGEMKTRTINPKWVGGVVSKSGKIK